MIPAQTARELLTVTAGPLGYVAPLLALAMLIARQMYAEGGPRVLGTSRAARVGVWLMWAVVVTGFVTLMLRYVALLS